MDLINHLYHDHILFAGGGSPDFLVLIYLVEKVQEVGAWGGVSQVSLISVRYGASGAPKNAGPRPNSPPRPAERPGARRVILRFPAPAPGPARSPDGSLLKQVGRNGAPSRE